MTYPIISLLCYIIVALIKKTEIKNEWLPLISCVIGGLLALLGFAAIREYMVAESLIIAISGGALSGLAATGGDQVFKQAVKLICSKYGLTYEKIEPVAETISSALSSSQKDK